MGPRLFLYSKIAVDTKQKSKKDPERYLMNRESIFCFPAEVDAAI